MGLGETTPLHFVHKTQTPLVLGVTEPDQTVTLLFFNAYCGSGLVIQCLARCQLTPNRIRACRMVSILTCCSVTPCSKQTSAANSNVHRLLSFSQVRGLVCNSARRDSLLASSKMVRNFFGRQDFFSKHASPF